MSGSWDLLVAGLFGLAAAWVPIGLTSRATRRQRRAALASVLLSECDRLHRAAAGNHAALKRGARMELAAAYDHILPGLHQAAYELALISKPAVRAAVVELREITDQLVFSSLPGYNTDEEREVLIHRFSNRKAAIFAGIS